MNEQRRDLGIRIMEFFSTYAPGHDGQPVATDWVKYGPVGEIDKAVIEMEVKRILKAQDFGADANLSQAGAYAKRQFIEPLYEAWKRGEELDIAGTPLSAWTQLNKDQAKALKAAGIRTVEEVSNLGDSQMDRVKLPGVRDLKRLAGKYLEMADANKANAEVQRKESEIADLKAKVEQLTALMSVPKPVAGKQREKAA